MSDYILIALVGLGGMLYLFKGALFGSDDSSYGKLNGNGSTYGGNTGKVGPAGANGAAVGNGGIAAAGRDLAKAMQLAVSILVCSILDDRTSALPPASGLRC